MEKVQFSKEEHTKIPDPAFPVNIFFIRQPDQGTIPLHWHNHYEWIYITKGSFRVQVGSEFKDMSEGDLIFVNREELHSAFPRSSESQLFAIVYNQSFLLDGELDRVKRYYLLPLLNNEFDLPFFYDTNTFQLEELQDCLTKLIDVFSTKEFGYEMLIKAYLLEATARVFQIAKVSPVTNRPISKHAVIEPILHHISNHFDESISVDQAADMCNLSPNYFCHIFKKATGYTLTEYINLIRVSEAERLIYRNKYTIQEIAYLVGFSNSTYFGRTFKKIKHKTPSEVLRLYLEGRQG